MQWLDQGDLVNRSRDEKPHFSPAFWVGSYNVALLFLYFLGMFTQTRWEGFGFLPLVAFTLPTSLSAGILSSWAGGLIGSGASFRFPGSSLEATLLINFMLFNVAYGSINSCILYFTLKIVESRREKRKMAL